jgi:hypothetical protein
LREGRRASDYCKSDARCPEPHGISLRTGICTSLA